ncbi:MAG TPA: TlpA family protein disulfide reductase [Ktedonobacteraceae bacterium]|nr:TlpA family protein disulfide reductase [Ktedonobacteraceae bacterium]
MDNEPITPGTGDAPVIAQRKHNAKKRNIIIFVVVSILNVGLLALLFTQLLTPASNNGATSSDPLIGQPAPNFTLSALSVSGAPAASTISLSNYKGQPVVLNVWNSTCVPCIAEAPMLQAQWQKAHTQGVVFLGVDLQDVQGDGQRFLQHYGITYPNVFDADGWVAINYGVTGTPETLFINRQGVIVKRAIGQLTAQSLQSDLQLITL